MINKDSWLPKEEVTKLFPQITDYCPGEVWIAPVNPHFEGSLGIWARSNMNPSEMEEKVLEAAYNGIIKPNDNIDFRLVAIDGEKPEANYRIIILQLPVGLEPKTDVPLLDVLTKIRGTVKEFEHFRVQYFMPMASKLLPSARLGQELVVGHLKDLALKGPTGKERYVCRIGGGDASYFCQPESPDYVVGGVIFPSKQPYDKLPKLSEAV